MSKNVKLRSDVSVKDASDEELERELARRKEKAAVPPQPLASPDFSKLRAVIIESVAEHVRVEMEDKDFKHYVYEAALTAVYGEAYWPWRNAQKWRGE